MNKRSLVIVPALIAALVLPLAGCGPQVPELTPQDSPSVQIDGPGVSATPPTDATVDTPEPSPPDTPITPDPAPGIDSVHWLPGGGLPEGVNVGKGFIAGLISLCPPYGYDDLPPESVVLIADGAEVQPQLPTLDPSGVISAWYAVPEDVQAIRVRLGDSLDLCAVPTPKEMETQATYTPLGEMTYTVASSPETDLRASPLLDAQQFSRLPADARVLVAIRFENLSRNVSRLAIADMGLPAEVVKEYFALMTGASWQDTSANTWTLSREIGDLTLIIDGWDGMRATGLNGLEPEMIPEEGNCAVSIRLLAESWNTEVGGDETQDIKGPKGNISIERVTILPDAVPQGVAANPGEVLVAIEFGGEAAALAAAMEKSAEALMYYETLKCPSIGAQENTLYFSVPLPDGPDRLDWLGAKVELPLP